MIWSDWSGSRRNRFGYRFYKVGVLCGCGLFKILQSDGKKPKTIKDQRISFPQKTQTFTSTYFVFYSGCHKPKKEEVKNQNLNLSINAESRI